MSTTVLNLTALQLNKLLDHLNAGGVPNAPDFTYEQTPDGLVLKQGDAIIARQHESGTWIRESVQTGVGSFHLGEAHSIKSVGQNVGFLNEFSQSNDDNKALFFPPWQAIRNDGETTVLPTYLKFSSPSDEQPNGNEHPSAISEYHFGATMTFNIAVGSVTVRCKENYTGKLFNIIQNEEGVEIYKAAVDVNATFNSLLTIPYRPPYFARNNDSLIFRLMKEDGTNLIVASGTGNTSVPWRKLRGMRFTDQEFQDKITGAASTITSNNLSSSRVVISNGSGKVGVSNVTTTELDVIDGSAASTNITISTADRFVMNDGGVMRQVNSSSVKNWIDEQGSGCKIIFRDWLSASTTDRVIYDQDGVRLTFKVNTTNGAPPALWLMNTGSSSILYSIRKAGTSFAGSSSSYTSLNSNSQTAVAESGPGENLLVFTRLVVLKNSTSLTASDLPSWKIFEIDCSTTDTSDGGFYMVRTYV